MLGSFPPESSIIFPGPCAGVERAWSHQLLPTAPRSAPLFVEKPARELPGLMAQSGRVAPGAELQPAPVTVAPHLPQHPARANGGQHIPPRCPFRGWVTGSGPGAGPGIPSTAAGTTKLAWLQSHLPGQEALGATSSTGSRSSPTATSRPSPCPLKWPPLAEAHGSSRRGLWPAGPSCPRPRQPGHAWPGPACPCGGGGGRHRTRGGRSTPPPVAGFGS